MNRVIRAEGTPETVWQPWLLAQRFETQSLSGLMDGADRLVVVAPHPDDEILACGGLLAMQAARGGSVLVVGVTDGEKSHAAVAEVDHRALAVQRKAERLEGVRRLGLSAHHVLPLRLPDGALGVHADRLQMRLASLLTSADLVVSTWRHDGHPDHDACGLAVARACALRGCRHLEAPVWMWNWASPCDARVPWQRMLALPLAASAHAAKQNALAAHQSQLETRGADIGPVLGENIRAGARRTHEYFFG